MKKKIFATVIMIVMIMFSTMLLGCGAQDTPTISEFFSNGKHYLCYTTSYTKGGQIIKIYFFEDGKVTELHGDAYGCTMGDIAQMSDDEIWSRYEEVKETYDGPHVGFKDKPMKFVIKTDGTGNVPEKENICVPNDNNTSSDAGVIQFDVNRGGVGGEAQIYDKTFFYFGTANSNYYCTTETIKMDDINSKNCIVDPGSQITFEE